MTKLRAERIKRGLTSQDLALFLKVSASWISALERNGVKGRRYRDKEAKLEKLFGLDFETLMQHTGPSDGPPYA